MPDIDLFEADVTVADDKDHFSELVGEGKRYKDAQAAGKALVEKDLFIEQLKRENAGLRTDISARARLEEIAERLAKPVQSPAPSVPPQEAPLSQEDATKLDPNKLAEIVDQRLTQREQARTTNENLSLVQTALAEKYGSNASQKLQQAAQKLGMSKQEMNSLAARSPKAFLALMDTADRGVQQQDPNPPRSSVFTPSNTNKKPNLKDWDHLKKDPRVYWSPKVQNEILAAAKQVGPEFYN